MTMRVKSPPPSSSCISRSTCINLLYWQQRKTSDWPTLKVTDWQALFEGASPSLPDSSDEHAMKSWFAKALIEPVRVTVTSRKFWNRPNARKASRTRWLNSVSSRAGMSEHVAQAAVELMLLTHALRAVAEPSVPLSTTFTTCKLLFGNGKNVTVLFCHAAFEQTMPRVFQM